VALPLLTALIAALTLNRLNNLMLTMGVAGIVRLLTVALIAVTPVFLYFAVTGTAAIMASGLLAMSLIWLAYWYMTHDLRYLAGSGMYFAVAFLAGYSSVFWLVGGMLMIMAVLGALGASGSEISSSLIIFTLPTAFAATMWTFFNWIIYGSPLLWLKPHLVDTSGSISLARWAEQTSHWVFATSPVTLFVVVLLALSMFRSSDRVLAVWMNVFVLIAIALPSVMTLLSGNTGYLDMRSGLTLFLVTMVAAACLYRMYEGSPLPLVVLLVLALSVPMTFRAWSGYEHSGLASTFVTAMQDRTSQEGTTTPDGFAVGIAGEQEMASYITHHVDTRYNVLTDSAQTYGVMLLSGHPEWFYNRSVSDSVWFAQARKPSRNTRYMLFNDDSGQDRLAQLYPADKREGAGWQLLHSNSRYSLYSRTGNPAPQENS
jgi:hypothetical protein